MTAETTTDRTMYERAPGKLVTHDWELVYPDWNPEKQPLREALCTLGNGYFATRGAFEEAKAGGPHYPGTYLAGGYNRLASEIAGRSIENEDLVNWPNWLPLSFRHLDGDWFGLDAVEVLEFRQALDVRAGVLRRRVRFRDGKGRASTLETRRLVSMAQPHLAAIEWTLTPENWSGPIEVRTALDGTISNDGVARYRQLNGRHLDALRTGRVGEEGIELVVRTNQSGLTMAQAARTRILTLQAAAERRTIESPGWIAQIIPCECRRGETLVVEKVAALYTSRDRAICEPSLESRAAIARAGSFAELLDEHARAWAHLWKRCDIRLDDNESSQFVLRLHLFHLLQTTSMNTTDLDAGVPSRGLHGEAYRGHVFWDEMFIFPLLNLRIPEVTRSLLMYRYRRLPEARSAARAEGYRGAMYPWQSGSNGREESQVLHLNPRSGRWMPDNTYRQRHVNATIALNVWQYVQATGDIEFLAFYGAEMIVEIARFWASVAHYNPDRRRYEIHGVVGPDEFHTKYPDSDELGLKNNAYTNVMASWTLDCARRALERLCIDRRSELLERLGVSDDERDSWDEISRTMFVPFHGEGIISQFEGYGDLEEFDWDGYRRKYGDIQRLDRILEAEGDTVNRYQAGKQADVLMLFYLFSSDRLSEIFERMGYPWEPETIPKNVSYYLRRTSHGSTLSRVVHSWVLARSDRERSWGLFEQALASDVADIQGGTTSEGIHLGAMAGTVDLVQRGYMGLETRREILWFNPCLPDALRGVQLRIRFRGHWVDVDVTPERLRLHFSETWPRPARIGCRHDVYTVEEGDMLEIPLKSQC
jgi:alpha,alpha-trehalase